MTPGRSHVPCGACNALVPADTGCTHWRPGLTGKAAASWALRRKMDQELADRRAAVADFRQVMGATS